MFRCIFKAHAVVERSPLSSPAHLVPRQPSSGCLRGGGRAEWPWPGAHGEAPPFSAQEPHLQSLRRERGLPLPGAIVSPGDRPTLAAASVWRGADLPGRVRAAGVECESGFGADSSSQQHGRARHCLPRDTGAICEVTLPSSAAPEGRAREAGRGCSSCGLSQEGDTACLIPINQSVPGRRTNRGRRGAECTLTPAELAGK